MIRHFWVIIFVSLLLGADIFGCWNNLVSPRVFAFCWLARLHKILTMDNLKKRNAIIVNGRRMCLENEGTISHLLIHCSYAARVWGTIFKRFGMN